MHPKYTSNNFNSSNPNANQSKYHLPPSFRTKHLLVFPFLEAQAGSNGSVLPLSAANLTASSYSSAIGKRIQYPSSHHDNVKGNANL